MTRFEFYRTDELTHTAKNLATYLQMMCAISKDFDISNRQLCDFVNIKNLTTLNDCRKQLVKVGLIEYTHIMRGNKVVSTIYKFKGFDDTKIIPNKNRINTKIIPNNDDTIFDDTNFIDTKNVSHTNILNEYTLNSSTSINECDTHARTHEVKFNDVNLADPKIVNGEVARIVEDCEVVINAFQSYWEGEKGLNRGLYHNRADDYENAKELYAKFKIEDAQHPFRGKTELDKLKFFFMDAFNSDEWYADHTWSIKIVNNQFNDILNKINYGTGKPNTKEQQQREIDAMLLRQAERVAQQYGVDVETVIGKTF